MFLCQAFPDTFLNGFDELFPFILFDLHNMFDFRIRIGVQVIERQVFQLVLYSTDSQTVCDRRIDIHSFQRNAALFFRRQEFQCTHIVNAVCQLDNHDTDVMGHGKQNLPDILRLLLFLVKNRNAVQLGDAVHQHRHILSELLPDIIQRIFRILYHIVEQTHADRIRIHSQIQQNICHRQRMDNIRFSGRAFLPGVCLFCQLIRRQDLAQIVLFIRRKNLLRQIRDRDLILRNLRFILCSLTHISACVFLCHTTSAPFFCNPCSRTELWRFTFSFTGFRCTRCVQRSCCTNPNSEKISNASRSLQ